jgi:3'(2'), 5'-bisphosphate nucleotidase
VAGGKDLLPHLRAAAREAAAAIMEVYSCEFEVRQKSDRSPVTLADERAEAILVRALEELTPGVPILAEEHCEAHGRPASAPSTFWLVDPLDGTRDFVRRNGEFSINLGLVEGRFPLLGLIHSPCADVTYAAAAGRALRQRGAGEAEPIVARRPGPDGLVVVHSRSHADNAKLAAYLAPLRVAERRHAGSALKFCLLAEGEADLYPRFGPTCEWDTAAGQAILEAAGGSVLTMVGERLAYGKPGFLNESFVASGAR